AGNRGGGPRTDQRHREREQETQRQHQRPRPALPGGQETAGHHPAPGRRGRRRGLARRLLGDLLRERHPALTRGSSRACSTAAASDATSTATAARHAMAATVLTSSVRIELMSRSPSPCQPKIFSVKAAPVSRAPKTKAKYVATGRGAVRGPWRISARRLVRPLAIALRR